MSDDDENRKIIFSRQIYFVVGIFFTLEKAKTGEEQKKYHLIDNDTKWRTVMVGPFYLSNTLHTNNDDDDKSSNNNNSKILFSINKQQ